MPLEVPQWFCDYSPGLGLALTGISVVSISWQPKINLGSLFACSQLTTVSSLGRMCVCGRGERRWHKHNQDDTLTWIVGALTSRILFAARWRYYLCIHRSRLPEWQIALNKFKEQLNHLLQQSLSLIMGSLGNSTNYQYLLSIQF